MCNDHDTHVSPTSLQWSLYCTNVLPYGNDTPPSRIVSPTVLPYCKVRYVRNYVRRTVATRSQQVY